MGLTCLFCSEKEEVDPGVSRQTTHDELVEHCIQVIERQRPSSKVNMSSTKNQWLLCWDTLLEISMECRPWRQGLL